MSNFTFEFTLEDATQEQAELLLEMICTWADHRNCWIAGGYRRAETVLPSPDRGRAGGEVRHD
jgi:hypothetical protein